MLKVFLVSALIFQDLCKTRLGLEILSVSVLQLMVADQPRQDRLARSLGSLDRPAIQE